MTMYLRRRAYFSAGDSGAHTGTPGGHNYTCELSVSGTIDPATGMVVNITDIDTVLKAVVVKPLNGTLLDRDVAAFAAAPPTPINIVLHIAERCRNRLPAECRLHAVTLWWLPAAWTSITFNPTTDEPMITVTRSYEFSASHRLHASALSDERNKEIFGKCNWSNGHGHNYEFEITLAGDPDTTTGMLVPIDDLDRIADEAVLTPFDHRNLNIDIPEFADLNPTSENLTKVIWDRFAARWQTAGHPNARLHRVVVRETARNYFEYDGS